MSANLRILLRIQLLIAWRGFWDAAAGKSRWRLILFPIMLVAFLPILGMFGAMYVGLYFGAEALGQGHLVLLLAFTSGQVLCLMFGIFYVISAFYFSKDLKQLVALPLRPGEIVLAKFLSVLVSEYMTIAPVVLPALVVYGIFAPVSWLYIPSTLLVFLLLPIFPVAVASLFSMLLMRATNLRRNRDLWRVVGALGGVVLAVGFQVVVRLGSRQLEGDGSLFSRLLTQQQGLVEGVGRYFPTSAWAAEALRAGAPGFGLGPLLLFTTAAVATLLIMTRVADKLFFGGLIGGDEGRSAGKALSRARLIQQTNRVRSPLWALVQREVRLLNRTPTFLMTAVIPVVLIPVFAVLPTLMGERDTADLLPKVRLIADMPVFAVGGIAVVLFMNAMSNLAATAISREGRHLWISRALPVAPRVQVLAKVIHSLLLTVLNILVVVGGLAYMGLLTAANLLYVVTGGLVASAAFNYAAIIIDLIRPSLTWTDPQKAMKGNTNGIFAFLLVLVMGGLLGAVTALLWVFARPVLMPGVLLFFALLAYGLHRLASYLADKRYLEYEE